MRVKYRLDGRLPPGEGSVPAVPTCSRLHKKGIFSTSSNKLEVFFMAKTPRFPVKTITSCAILTALGIIIARLFSLAPNEFTRFSFESVPIFLSGLLFGPMAGAMVGFATDFIGCLFSPYGFNPLFCLPPILYGLCGGIFRRFLAAKPNLWRIALSFLPAVTLGSILWQSFALDFVYGSGFFVLLGSRSIQFAIVFVLDTVLTFALLRSKVFHAAGLWPPKGGKNHDR